MPVCCETEFRPLVAAGGGGALPVGAADRMARLTGQMLAYSGRGRFVVEPVDLSGRWSRSSA